MARRARRALSASALVAAFVFPPVLANTSGSTLEILGTISYPLADLLLVAFVLFALAMTGWRPGPVLGGAAAAFGVDRRRRRLLPLVGRDQQRHAQRARLALAGGGARARRGRLARGAASTRA